MFCLQNNTKDVPWLLYRVTILLNAKRHRAGFLSFWLVNEEKISYHKSSFRLSTRAPFSWYNGCTFTVKGGFFMPEEVKSPISMGLLAHVGASRGASRRDSKLPGCQGTVRWVDDMGTIHVSWDCGSGLGLIPSEDAWKKVTE